MRFKNCTVNAWQVNSSILFMYWIVYDVEKEMNLWILLSVQVFGLSVGRLIHSWDLDWGYSFFYSDFDPISKYCFWMQGEECDAVALWWNISLDTTNRAKICVSLKPFYTFSIFFVIYIDRGLNGFLKYLHIKILELKSVDRSFS